LLRLRADFDNYRKRVARDAIETIKRANEDLIEALLPALDHFASAETMMEQKAGPEAAPYLEGFRMVKNELARALESYGLKPVPALDLPFDANLHEAISTRLSESSPPGTVLFEARKGYTLNGKLLRASQVVVAEELPGESESKE
jgi:molecular chaperone GrpE